ncbi:MAG: amidohydrolase [Promethearchaeota archaeon]|jgi:predicted amidohydrolase YtcJ
MIYADLILTNGKVITMDAQESISQAVAVKFGKIIAVGNNSDIGNYVGEETVSIDLLGKTVLPGFIDSHGHFLNEGSSREIYIDLSEEAGIHSISDIQHILTEKAKQTPIGEWIFGYQEDDSKLEEKRHPTILELDVASINHPILITTVGGHFWMANSKAFELAGVIKDSPDPIGGKFDRDPQSGELTGGLHEEAYYLLRPEGSPQPNRDQSYIGAKQILSECSSVGLTCIYDLVGRSEIRAAIDLKNAGELPIRVRMDVTIALLDELDMLGIYRGLGDNWVRICGIKFFFDGAISARTAAVSEPYLDKPDFFGVMATTKEKATELLTKAYQKGFRISAHANGDRAIKIYLDIIEELQKKYPRLDSRNRDIHCSVINEDLIKKIKELDVLPTIFGAYAYYHGDKLIPSFGIDRLENMFAARSFLDAGILVSAHSDHPCSPFPPLMAIHSLVNRKTKAGKLIGRSQQISVIEALKLYTINAAYHSFDENILGSIEPNKLADFVILEEDILTVPSERIRNIPINMTIIEGKIIYQRQ